MTCLNAAAIQMCTGIDVTENLVSAEALVAQASEQGANLVVLPEYFPFMGEDLSAKLAIMEPAGNGRIQQAMSNWAKQYGVWLVGGSIPIISDIPGKPFARCYVFNEQGKIVTHYDKIHMFDVQVDDNIQHYRESDYSLAGEGPVICDTPWGAMGIAVCYDIRFPELFRYYFEHNVSLVVLPSAFTVPTGRAHWEVLLRARAIENQCFMIAAAQSGLHENGRETWGHSMIVDPWGKIITEIESQTGAAVASLDMALIEQLAEKMPVKQHRKEL